MLTLILVGIFGFCFGGTVGIFVSALMNVSSKSEDTLYGDDQYK